MSFEVSRTAVITGAGSGIGRATARAFLDAGWQVVLAGRRKAALQETVDGDARTLVVPADVTRPDDVERLFAAAAGRFGRVDVLFNNAGSFGPSGSVDQISSGTGMRRSPSTSPVRCSVQRRLSVR